MVGRGPQVPVPPRSAIRRWSESLISLPRRSPTTISLAWSMPSPGTIRVATAAAPTGLAMPAFGWLLDDQQTAAVLTYIRNAWGNAASRVTGERVAKRRAALATGE